jgi:hypothetical protein
MPFECRHIRHPKGINFGTMASMKGKRRVNLWGEVIPRFLGHLCLIPLGYTFAFFLTIPLYFPHEHPFQSAGGADYNKLPAAFSLHLSTPLWIGLGFFSGLLFSTKASVQVRQTTLFVCGLAWFVATLLWPQALTLEPWPSWYPAVCLIGTATVVCRFWQWRTETQARRVGVS